MMKDQFEYELQQQRRQTLMHEAAQHRLAGAQPQTRRSFDWLWRLTNFIGLFL